MAQMLGSVGSFFSGPTGKAIGTIGELGATGLGLAGNISADRQRSAAASEAQKNMNLSPQQLAQMVSGAQQPLNKGLVQAVTNNVNANLAEQGLSQAPGIIATTESQALAPFEQQNQQAALQLVLQKLGLPAEFAKTIPPNANLAPLLSLLFKGAGGGGGGTPSANPFQTTGPNPLPPNTPDPNLGDWGNLFSGDTSSSGTGGGGSWAG